MPTKKQLLPGEILEPAAATEKILRLERQVKRLLKIEDQENIRIRHRVEKMETMLDFANVEGSLEKVHARTKEVEIRWSALLTKQIVIGEVSYLLRGRGGFESNMAKTLIRAMLEEPDAFWLKNEGKDLTWWVKKMTELQKKYAGIDARMHENPMLQFAEAVNTHEEATQEATMKDLLTTQNTTR